MLILFYCNQFMLMMMKDIKHIVCLCGNDGTGKSTLSSLLPSLFPQTYVIERSSKGLCQQFQPLRQQIKHVDFLTYRYSYEPQRYQFEPSTILKVQDGRQIFVHWIMLHLDPQQIFKRISSRLQMGIYESKKCVEYYSYVYLELAAFYGMTVVDVSSTPKEIADNIYNFISSGATTQIMSLALKGITLQKIDNLNIEAQIIKNMPKQNFLQIVANQVLPFLKSEESSNYIFLPELEKQLNIDQTGHQNWELISKMAARWFLIKSTPSIKDGKIYYNLNMQNNAFEIQLSSPSFRYFVEGESKRIYSIESSNILVSEYFSSKLIILLKSTIYSHTNQVTGEIENLGKIRSVGSNIFLQMLRRNNIKHAYLAINRDGIILSNKIQTNNVEVVFKKQLIGTDKHSYYLFNQSGNVDEDSKYKQGIYVRFDWRNPNHMVKGLKPTLINMNPFYYIIERYIGKQKFFLTFLKKTAIVPLGDKAISEDILRNYVDTTKIKKFTLSLYCSFTYYCKRIGLQIVDGCFMFDNNGTTVWSEINPDCMRVKRIETREDLDKDIWRVGGSSSKEKILEKWTYFNSLFINYFMKNRFHETELVEMPPLYYSQVEESRNLLTKYGHLMSQQYNEILKDLSNCCQKNKDLIATIDISDHKPTLVKSSQFSQNHSENSLQKAFSALSLLPKVVLVDLDAAMGKQTNNRCQIKSLNNNLNNNIYGVGGGIRNSSVLNYYLNELQIPKAIISSNLQLLQGLTIQTIKNRIIVQLSINQQNQILTHGRTINTHQNVVKKLMQLSKLGVQTVSLTFNHKEGHLQGIPRHQFRDIMFQVPGPIKTVIIAGGITNMEDIQYIWGFPKAVPQLGSAIWKKTIAIEDICNQMINFNKSGLCPAIITDQSQRLLGEVYVNKQAITKICLTRQLYRYSRKLKRLIQKGEQSGNIQEVLSFRFDCDRDCLNIIVKQSDKPFCHFDTRSCFNQLKHTTHNIISLQNHIARKRETGSGYSKKLQENSELALCKVKQEAQEFILTENRVVQEGADLISHLLMYLNSKNISFSEIVKQMQIRSNIIKPAQKLIAPSQKKPTYIGVMGGKHFEKIDVAMLQTLGIKVIRSKGRSLKIDYIVEDHQKFNKYFLKKQIVLIGIKSKDMAQVLKDKQISYCFNYTIMMENYPKVWFEHFRSPISQIKLVLLERKDHPSRNPSQWTRQDKGRIASEYPRSVNRHFNSLGIREDCYRITHVCGGTESFMQISDFDFCDAIMQSGKTIEENNLFVSSVLCPEISAALYSLI